MLVNPMLLEELTKDAGEDRAKKALKYLERIELTNVEYIDLNNFEISAKVYGNDVYNTYISVKNGEIEDISCTCPDYHNHYGVCKHTLATVLFFNERNFSNNQKEKETSKAKFRNFKQLVNVFYNEEIEEIDKVETVELKNSGSIKLEPKILYDKFTNSVKVEFKIGNRKMYKLKNLSEFYDRMMNKEFYRYGERLQFVHIKEMFDKDSLELLDFILKYAEIIKYTNSNSNSNYRYFGNALSETNIVLGNSGIDEFFEIVKNKRIAFQRNYNEELIYLVDVDPEIFFVLNKVKKSEYELVPNIDLFNINIIDGKDYKYLLIKDKLYRCSLDFQNTTLKFIQMFRQNYLTEVYLQEEDLVQLYSVIIPKVKNAVVLGNVEESEIEKYRPQQLIVKVFLDFDENDYLIADVKFCYGENEFNPLDEKEKKKFPRNMLDETKALNKIRKSGFMFDVKNLRFILPNNDKIYEFLINDIEDYMKNFEVMVTENFKSKEVSKPKMSMVGVKVENNLLEIDLSKLNIDVNELRDVLLKYKLKKKYYRLKDGSFLSLEDNKEIEFIDKLVSGIDIDSKEIKNGEIRLPVNRSLYLDQLLKEMKTVKIEKDKTYRDIVHDFKEENLEEDVVIPSALKANLRDYQKIGFKWLKSLDNYKFGGILADDMGLGKTIQVLAIILDYMKRLKNKDERKTSIVVSPSSLTLNWFSEAQKFAPSLRVQVISGSAEERKEKINKLEEYDLILTSYDLLKRDIDVYKEKDYEFRYAIADEAQYLKNSSTKNAIAIKKIRAQSRFALTGTPIENSLAELWSIFDFIMPGYLFTYKKFKNMYEIPIVKEQDENATQKLKSLIQPFVLRRTKQEVLTELPDKTVTVLNNEMNDEQNKIYLTYLAQAKQEVMEVIGANSIDKSQIKILSLLTRLRQICCHPKLFIENYNGESSKLSQCMEIVEDAINAKHRILLFSTYTSMLGIIEDELKNRNIEYLKLTGQTKVTERVDLVNEFNEKPNIKVFLISLKAGGTGLNLTGADMVIHYDPWWNLSAESQATDRAYRIGQKNNVQVYKLITKNSIEEKIYDLQQKKSKLIDDVLSTNTTFINRLSKDDILNLFS